MRGLEMESAAADDSRGHESSSSAHIGSDVSASKREQRWDSLVGINPAAWWASLRRTPQLLRERAFRTRTLADALEEKDQESGGGDMQRKLNWFDLICIGIGVILGSGVFTSTPYVAAHLAGPAVVASYAVSSISAVASALCYAEYAVDFPIAGGGYGFVSLTYGEFIGWIEVANLLFGYCVSAAAVARSSTQYWSQLFNSDLSGLVFHKGGWTVDFVAAGLVVLLSLLVVYGAKEGSLFNIVVTVVHVAVLLFIIAAGAVKAKPANLEPFAPFGARGVFSGAAYVYFTYTGFDAVATSAEECKNPKRDLPVGIVGSLVVTTLLYVATALVLVLMVPYTSISDSDGAFALAFADVGMGWARYLVSAGALLGMVSSCYVALYGQARILCVVARDHMLPPVLARISPRLGTPTIAATVMGLATAGVALLTGFEELFVMTSCLALMTFWLTAHGCMLRRYYVRGENSPAVPLAFMAAHTVCSLGFSVWYQASDSWVGLVAFGVPIVIMTAALHAGVRIRYLPEDFALMGGPWLPSVTAFINVFLMASLKGAGTSGFINIAYFMAATTALYLLYSLHTTAYKGSTAGGAPVRGAAPEELVAIVAAGDGSPGAAAGQRGSGIGWEPRGGSENGADYAIGRRELKSNNRERE